MARNRRRRRGTHVGLAVAVTGALQGCAPSPVDPGPGELTGVVVPRGDTFVLGGGGPSDAYDRVLVLTSEELLAAYRRTWPGKDDPLDHEYANIGVRIPVADLEQLDDRGEPASAQAVAPVVDGRFRIPWSSDPRYVCLADEIRTDAEDELVTDTAGCVMVDRAAPAAVTIALSTGGLALAV